MTSEDKVQSPTHQPSVAAGGLGLPFQVRGSMQTILSLRLLEPGHPDFFALLLDKIAHSPDFFRAAPVVLDVGPIAEQPPFDLKDFAERLRAQRLYPVGVQNGGPAWVEAAQEAGLAVMGAGAAAAPERPPRKAEVAEEPRAPAPVETPPPAPRRGPATVVTETVRGGQQIVVPDGDLVVTAPVGHGAEVAAGGHVHVYGALRGRAFAGIEGDEGAMIFCDQLDAQLLSIAGVHLVSEEIDPQFLGRRVRVRLEGERLVIQAAG
jgi:septum site-determining protein MinC